MNINELYSIYLQFPSVQTDTRKIQKGDLFFALKGPNFNGNHYAKNALDAGAAYCIVDEIKEFNDDRLIKVDDVLHTLQSLAKKHRERFTIPFIAITGSNGKTTTKELIHAVLSSTYKTYTTEGNLNNHIGIPLTILKIRKDADFAVIEMGANHQKEIEGYCEYTMPTHGIITNCGKAHLEGFGGEEGVRKGKGELYEYLKKNGGVIFAYKDYDYLQQMSTGSDKIIYYSSQHNDAAIKGSVLKDDTFLEVAISKGSEINCIKTKLVGGYNLPNVLAAVAIGTNFHVPAEKIKAALENYIPTNSRSQLLQMDRNQFILDAYNANPSSMKLSIENFAKMPGSEKIIMVGGMMELGEESNEEHKKIIALIDEFVWKKVILVGEQFKDIHKNHLHFNSSMEARDWFVNERLSNVQILIKGSRSMQMEKIIE